MTPLITLFNSEERRRVFTYSRVGGSRIMFLTEYTQFNFDHNSTATLSARVTHVYTDGLQFPAGWQTIASSPKKWANTKRIDSIMCLSNKRSVGEDIRHDPSSVYRYILSLSLFLYDQHLSSLTYSCIDSMRIMNDTTLQERSILK